VAITHSLHIGKPGAQADDTQDQDNSHSRMHVMQGMDQMAWHLEAASCLADMVDKSMKNGTMVRHKAACTSSTVRF
jgi:hypothetical protein